LYPDRVISVKGRVVHAGLDVDGRIAPPRVSRRSLAFACFLGLISLTARAAPPDAVVHGIVTIRGRLVPLAGVVLTLVDQSGRRVDVVRSDPQGRFEFRSLRPGRYRLRTSALDLVDTERDLTVDPLQALDLQIELDLLPVSETVHVMASSADPETGPEPMGARPVPADQLLNETPIASGRMEEALALLPGVILEPGGLSVKGGWRIGQTSAQIDDDYAVDPSTGNKPVTLPPDSLASIEVLGAPYLADLGRFSAGAVVFHTRKGGDRWQTLVNGLIPSVRVARDNQLKPIGIDGFAPRFSVAGPLVKDRLFTVVSGQYFYAGNDTRSRPVDELSTQRELRATTRVDAILAPAHTLTGRWTGFSQRLISSDLSTFNPPEVTCDIRQSAHDLSLAERSVLGKRAVLESALHVSHYDVLVDGHGSGAMRIAPQGNSGSFFNTQSRRPWTWQWRETFSRSVGRAAAEHLLTAGLDVLHAGYEGASLSRDVEIQRLDGSLAERIAFGPQTAQRVSRTDASAFLQDRWRAGARTVVELGFRLENDGVLGDTSALPRAGIAISPTSSARSQIRAGVGAYAERTPLSVAAFDSFEPRTASLFDRDGVTPFGPSVTFVHRVGSTLAPPQASSWTVGYEHRFGRALTLATNYFDRRGRNELIVEPLRAGAEGTLLLSGRGHSRYRSADISGSYTAGRCCDLSGSYTHAYSRADLNAYTVFFGTVRSPLIHANEYGPTEDDVPDRLVLRGRFEVGGRWLFVPVFTARSGFPYSSVDQEQRVIGPRNGAGRFPEEARLNLSVERRFRALGWDVWLGLRLFNVLNRFAPVDVQQNVDASDFRKMYGSVPFQYRFSLRLSR
jgi:hypothetical protein